MTTPNTRTTSMITTATTMMTDVVFAVSLRGVGCMLLLIGIVSVVVIPPTVWRQVVSLGIDAGEI